MPEKINFKVGILLLCEILSFGPNPSSLGLIMCCSMFFPRWSAFQDSVVSSIVYTLSFVYVRNYSTTSEVLLRFFKHHWSPFKFWQSVKCLKVDSPKPC